MLEVGKEAYCIQSHSAGNYKKGNIYTINAIKKGCSHYPVLLDIGVNTNIDETVCDVCHAKLGADFWADASRFVSPDDISLTEIEEVLQKEPYSI